MPNDSANYNVAVSDGKWDNCGNLVANCDFDPWDNYLGNWFSPTAELRLWVDGIYRGGPYSSGNWMQEYGLSAPRLGIANCIGSGAGEASVSLSATDNVQTSASYGGTVQGQVSIGYGYNYTYQVKFKYNGECGTGVPDGYSEYFNENWQGNPIGMTASPQTFDSVAGFSGGPNNSLWIDVNIVPGFTVTYANNSVKSVDLFENYGIGGNGPGDNATYGVDEWSWA